MKKGYVETAAGQVHYLVEGSGPPLLLLHQTPTSSDEYALMLPLLGRTFRTMAMDSMGYGMSSIPDRPYSIQDHAQAVRGFLAAMGIKRTHLLGHHTGASIALEFAASFPDTVDKLVLSGCPYYEPDVRRAKLADPKFRPMQFDPDGAFIMNIWNHQKNSAPTASPELWYRALMPRLMAGKRGEDAHQAVFQFNEQERLPRLKCPTLLISGTKDTFISKMEPTRRLVPNCQVALIEGSGSLVALTHPQELADKMLHFLA